MKLGKYLKDLGLRKEDIPSGWGGRFFRRIKWFKQRLKYGFDDRETYSLNSTFNLWLYQRLMMYNEINIVDTTFHKYTFEGKEITFQECIDKMLEGLKIALVINEFEYTPEEAKKVEDVVKIFALCFPSLWW